MLQLNNPAGRLLNIIQTGRRQPGEKQAAEVWANILRVPVDSKSELLRRIGLVLSLPSEISEKISNIEEIDSPVYLKWVPKVEQAFSILNFQIQWKQFIAHFDPSVEYGLEICSEVLSRSLPEKTADEEKIEQIISQIEGLITFIEGDNIDLITKKFILNSLQSILKSLHEINIAGLHQVEKEFNSIIGAIVINNNYNLDSGKSESVSKFWKIITGISLILSISANAIMIGEKAMSLLPENPQNIEGEVNQNKTNMIDI